ncbi:phage tail assembly protein [Neisseria leonii]|uniref:Phage tail assembly protein n=1 Tax=Neisseria leonii TaxID=2995413 RepID=A0A9X4E2U0_9NEIS|nr:MULTISPECIES: phage tail assembly protein [unclassified Neisseria]MDD9324747.1 phage tail assembly protein [Neisseria sp. 3986]MDD9327690.1 phage tail assembly protein [Neisseria sp. 51.81]
MRTQVITLKHGFSVGGKAYQDVVLRAPNLGDLMAAEDDAPAYNPISFKVALCCRCIEKLEGADVPVTMGMMRALQPADWQILSKAMDDWDQEGKGV